MRFYYHIPEISYVLTSRPDIRAVMQQVGDEIPDALFGALLKEIPESPGRPGGICAGGLSTTLLDQLNGNQIGIFMTHDDDSLAAVTSIDFEYEDPDFDSDSDSEDQEQETEPVATISDLKLKIICSMTKGKGHGELLLDVVKNLAGRLGCNTIFLNPVPRSQNFYKKNGFSDNGGNLYVYDIPK